MSDYLLQCAASNWLVSTVLAVFAWFAQSKLRRPVIAHLLWLLVLVKLVTPPLFSLPVLPAPEQAAAPAMGELPAVYSDVVPVAALPEPAVAAPLEVTTVLLGVWLLGSLVVLLWSSIRITRFHRLLTQASRPAPKDMVQRATQLAKTLGLKKTPSINITSARVSPMVWWVGGKVRIFIPEAMPAELGGNQMRWILAHELGHVRRRDHFVRWLEWLACVAFWWNPIAWLARRNLRANEEVCCDALVLRSLQGKPHSYANSLLAAVEFLASPGLRPPAMASEINSGGFLERRFRMIVSKTPIKTTPRWMQAVLLVCTVAVMPLGIAYAQNPDVGAVTKRLRKAVQAGELTPVDARKMLRTLKESNTQDPRRESSQRAKEQEHYNRLVRSLKNGLQEALDAGQIDDAEAARLYQRQMRILNQGPAKGTGKAPRAAQGKDLTLEDLKRALERAMKSGRITKEEAMQRVVEYMQKQEAKGKRLDVNTQRMRDATAEEKVHWEAVRKDREAAKQAVNDETDALRKQFEIAKRRLEDTRRTLEDTHAARAEAMRQLEIAQRDKAAANARKEAKQLDALEKARRDLAKKASHLRKMQSDLANEQAQLEAAANKRYKGRDVRIDLTRRAEEVERVKAEKKDQAERNRRIRWKKAIDLSNQATDRTMVETARRDANLLEKKAAEQAKQLRDLELLKVEEARAKADKLRAFDFSKKKNAVKMDLDRLRALELELKQLEMDKIATETARAAELMQHKAIELELRKQDQNLKKKKLLEAAKVREWEWRKLNESGQKEAKKASDKPLRVQLQLDAYDKAKKVDASKERTWRGTLLKTAKKEAKAQWQLNLSLAKEEKKLAEEAARATLRLKEQDAKIRELDTRLDTERQEQSNRRSLERRTKAKDLKTRATDLKRELELQRAALQQVEADVEQARKETRRRSGIR